MLEKDLLHRKTQLTRKSIISIIVIWFFILLEVTTILFGYEKLFSYAIILSMLCNLGFILWSSIISNRFILGLLIPFTLGMIIEYVGVNYGVIFGEYTYGDSLGIKILGVPLIVGINWSTIIYCTSGIAGKISANKLVVSALGALLFVALDIIIEASAHRFDFWKTEVLIPNLNDYVGWLVATFIVHFLFLKVIKVFNYTIAIHIFTSIFIINIILIYFTNTIM